VGSIRPKDSVYELFVPPLLIGYPKILEKGRINKVWRLNDEIIVNQG